MDSYLELAAKMYPNASCELVYHNPFELLIAVMLSAQTTDKAVNKITAIMFDKYKTVKDLANADVNDLEYMIRPIGLSKNKSKYVLAIAREVHEKYNDIVPADYKILQTLPGIGRKTANVVMSTVFNEPHIAVDTHVYRVTTRLGIVPKGVSTLECEKTLQKRYPKEEWTKAHHTFLFLGRYCCKSVHPKCEECLLNKICKSSTKI